jgi:hypothetical protein
MDILPVGQFVFILKTASNMQESVFVKPAAVAGADAGK